MSRPAREFSRFAGTYSRHNRIQAKAAEKLVSMLPEKEYKKIIDIGCGSGEIYRNFTEQGISFEHLTALDISTDMLELHPDDERVDKLCVDFSDMEEMDSLPFGRYDLVISSSSLQWSSNLDATLEKLSKLSDNFYFAIFTSNTFSSLHRCAEIKSPIYTESHLREKIEKYFNAHFETVQYKLYFDSVYKMLRYIKESGTSGGERRLSYREMLSLIENYPHNYLEFELLYASPKS